MRAVAATFLFVLLCGVTAAAQGERVHVVKAGESLSQIAARLVGDPGCWPVIYRANRDQIKDPWVLHPGQRLSIPDFTGCQLPPVAADAEAREP